MKYGTIGEDGCPCGEYEDKLIKIRAHCWRTSDDCDCKFSGVHYWIKAGVDPIKASIRAREIADYIKEAWRTDVAMITMLWK